MAGVGAQRTTRVVTVPNLISALRLACAPVFLWLLAGRRLGRLLDRIGDEEGRRIRPLAYGMTAALAGTIAANFFYLTMQFYYFYAFLAFALALPVVFGWRARERGT